MSKHIVLKPKMTEKTYAQSAQRVYAFEVPRDVNKHTIARAVETQFEVKVSNVNVVNVKGKAKRTITKGGRRVANGRDNDTKKAYVTLAAGNELPFFNAIEEAEEKQSEVQEKVTKAAEKSAAKEAKKESKAAKAKETK